MRIGVNARLFLPAVMEGVARYCWETTSRMILDHPEDHFILFFDRPIDSRYRIAENMTCVRSLPPTRHPVLWKWWFDYSLPRLFRKHNIDVFYSGDGFMSLRSKVPTLLVSHDITYFHFPADMKTGHLDFYRKRVPIFHEKAAHIVSVSDSTKADIVKHLGLDPSKITVAYNALPDTPSPFSGTGLSPKKESFVLYLGSLHPRKNVENLLWAYDEFVEGLQVEGSRSAPPKLKIVGRPAFDTRTIDETHASMKNGKLVEFVGMVNEEEKWTFLAEASFLCYVSKWEGFGIPLLEAMSVGTPVITSDRGALKEVGGDAALLVSPENISDIAEKMTRLWTDNDLRQRLISKGKKRVLDFDWGKTAAIIYDELKKIARKPNI